MNVCLHTYTFCGNVDVLAGYDTIIYAYSSTIGFGRLPRAIELRVLLYMHCGYIDGSVPISMLLRIVRCTTSNMSHAVHSRCPSYIDSIRANSKALSKFQFQDLFI